MRSTMILLAIVLLSASVIAADFSGAWTLNKDKSELGEGGRGRMAATKLVVDQIENSLAIESTRMGRNGEERTMKEEMTLDGKEAEQTTNFGKAVSKAGVDGDILTISTTRTFERNGETFEMKSEQKWQLAEAGKVLKIDLKSSSPRGEREMKLVYDKQ